MFDLKQSQEISDMRKILLLSLFAIFYGCSNNPVENVCFGNFTVSETINLDLPEFIDLQVPGGWAYANGGIKGIIVYNQGTQFKAFDRLCPEQNPSSSCSQMIVDNNLRMVCPCDDSEFNILNGAPLTEGIDCFANEYLVENLGGSILRISNF